MVSEISSFPGTAFAFSSLNRKERERETHRQTDIDKQILDPHPAVPQGNDSLMNPLLSHLGDHRLQGAQALRPGLAQVVV